MHDRVRDLRERWASRWKELPRHPRLTWIDPTMPSGKYGKMVKEVKRSWVSLIMQFHSGHIPLNKYLHQIMRVESLQCPS